jgi:hypothetical protein
VLAVNSCANGDCEELIKMGKVMVSGCSQDYARCAGRLAFDVLVAKGAGRAAAAVAEAKVVANAARVAKAAETADAALEAAKPQVLPPKPQGCRRSHSWPTAQLSDTAALQRQLATM